MVLVPDFRAAETDIRVALLKDKCESARALGLARVSEEEIMVIYQGMHHASRKETGLTLSRRIWVLCYKARSSS